MLRFDAGSGARAFNREGREGIAKGAKKSVLGSVEARWTAGVFFASLVAFFANFAVKSSSLCTPLCTADSSLRSE
jgi:hypothetical protein